MRVLVTGGAGFIGANLCARLVADGHETVVVDDLSTGYRSNLNGIEVDLRIASILDVDALTDAARGCEAIVHLAARASVPRSVENPTLTHDINVNGTVNVLEIARNLGARVVFASSSSVYGANERLPKVEDMRPQPLSPYAASKLAGESYVLAYHHVYGIRTLAFRFFNVYGPLQSAGHAYAAVVPAFTDNLLRGVPLTVHGDGLQCRDFTSVDSVTRILRDAVLRQIGSPDPINLAFGSKTSLIELIRRLEATTGLTASVTHVASRPGDVRASQADNQRLLALFPDAEPQPLEIGLRETVEWFRRRAAS